MSEAARDLYLLIAVIGLAPAVAQAGMPFLAQSAFVALGGIGTLQLERLGLPIGGAGLVAILAGGGLGYAVGLLVARAETANVALASWALAWLVYTALLAFPALSGGDEGLTRPAPDHVQTVFGALTLTPAVHLVTAAALCALALWATARLRAGPAGVELIAIAERPDLAASLGTPVVARRAAAVAVAGAAGAAAGAGVAVLLGVAAPADVSPLLALQLFAAVIVGGRSPVLGPLLGFAAIWAITPLADLISGPAGGAANGVITAALLVACVAARPLVRRLTAGGAFAPPRLALAGVPAEAPPGEAAAPPTAGAPPAAPSAASPLPEPAAPSAAAGVLLEARGLECSLGGVEILRGVGLRVHAGEIHALIGPNGSGKTTALRVLAGAVSPTAGVVVLDGEDVTHAGQRRRVKRGLVRTFQELAGFDGLTPYQQVRLAIQGGGRSPRSALAHFAGLHDAAAEHDERAWAVLALAELTKTAHRPPGALGAGERRLLQVARAAATGAHVLALDEPAAGMSAEERETLLRVLRRLADQGRGVLVVEHDLRLVARAADSVTVLDEGRAIAVGTPAEVAADPLVRRAYLGLT